MSSRPDCRVSKRTAYQHFTTKDELVAEYLRQFDPDVMPGVFDRADLTPRERLLAAFEMPASSPLCPYIAAAVELHDPQHPSSQYARDYKTAIAARLTETAREAGATDPNSSANNWRCSSTAPRPAPKSSIASLSPPPPPSPQSSSTTPSPSHLLGSPAMRAYVKDWPDRV